MSRSELRGLNELFQEWCPCSKYYGEEQAEEEVDGDVCYGSSTGRALTSTYIEQPCQQITPL